MPASLFQTKRKEAALALCRELTNRGLQHQRFWEKGAPTPDNHFRTYTCAATATLPKLYRVRYVDCTAGPRIPLPAKPARPKSKDLPASCANAKVGCPRPRVYLDGYCKRCHDRREYHGNPELRERKRAAAIANGKARRARRREEREAA